MPNGTVEVCILKTNFVIQSTSIDIGVPKQHITKKKSPISSPGILMHRAKSSFMSPAPITLNNVNRKPITRTIIGIIIFKSPKTPANEPEQTNTSNTLLFLICRYNISVIQQYVNIKKIIGIIINIMETSPKT